MHCFRSLFKVDSEAVATVVGYCPQFDAFVPQLTGRENLRLFARLRGVSGEQISLYVTELLRHLTLEGCVDRPAETYSGGNKRKLSVGIALIGNPPIVILDEPSTGVDPQARRSMWRLISSTMAHRSVILTTHSMEEAEALCDRVSIMHAGVLKCIGRPTALKSSHGGGFLVTLSSARAALLEVAAAAVLRRFPHARRKDRRGVTLKIFLPAAAETTTVHAVGAVSAEEDGTAGADAGVNAASVGVVTAARVFRALEEIKAATGVDTYSVATSTLEDVFLRIVAPSLAASAIPASPIMATGTATETTAGSVDGLDAPLLA